MLIIPALAVISPFTLSFAFSITFTTPLNSLLIISGVSIKKLIPLIDFISLIAIESFSLLYISTPIFFILII